jgi:hypothetical protein
MNKAGPIFGDEAMNDTVTIGTLAASALAMASDETVKGFVGEAVKDAYKALKTKIARWTGADVDALEKAPASAVGQSAVAEAIDGQPPGEQALVKALAAELVAALKSETHAVIKDKNGIRSGDVLGSSRWPLHILQLAPLSQGGSYDLYFWNAGSEIVEITLPKTAKVQRLRQNEWREVQLIAPRFGGFYIGPNCSHESDIL